MRQYLLYIGSKKQLADIINILNAKDMIPLSKRQANEVYLVRHEALGDSELVIHLTSNFDSVLPHMKQNPVDLLIYDERGRELSAINAIRQVKKEVADLAAQWGPDFHFPISRTLAILENRDIASQMFLLGRERVKEVLVDPPEPKKIFFWVARILRHHKEENQNRVGMALSGGGLEGFLYQVGCCYALNTAVSGKSLYDCEVLSGISSGSIVAAAIAGKVPLEEVIKAFEGRSQTLPHLKASDLYDVAVADILKRIGKNSFAWHGVDPVNWSRNIMNSVPTGFFKGDKLKSFIKKALQAYNIDDSFDQLSTELYIGATSQESFEHTVMGLEPWQNVSVSDAVRASCALPPFYTPEVVDGQRFIDGQITRSCNLQLVVERGCNLVFIIDPLKPFVDHEPGGLDRRGGIYTLIQTIKALVHTRLSSALSHLTELYPDVDFLVFQPYEDCAAAMAGSPMRLKMRTKIVDLAFKGTLRRLRERHHIYSEKLEKYDFQLLPQNKLLEAERKGLEI